MVGTRSAHALLGILFTVATLAAAPVAGAQPAPPPSAAAPPKVVVTPRGVEIDGAPALATDALFEVGEPGLRAAAAPVIDALAKALLGDGSPRFLVHVHSDDVAPDGDGSGAWLLRLTQRRADALRAALVRRGVPARKLIATGHGAARPAGDNRTEAGRRTNRRVEIAVESDVRAPTATDLAGYLRAIRGTGKLVAAIATNRGTLRCELFEQQAPMTVANFVGLATGQKPWLDPRTRRVMKGKPFYDGLGFHRAIPQFMIQGGDPLGNGTGGPGYQFSDEISPALTHQPGTLSMANAGPGTNGSQFFINEVATPWLDGKHTVFGHCREVAVVAAITAAPRSGDAPAEPVTIVKVTLAREP
jgi:cyclophilin family peptidyl-prolyl cis-trans isomerase/outer membrane protein OmpA-like peptidoglycan-associated protein